MAKRDAEVAALAAPMSSVLYDGDMDMSGLLAAVLTPGPVSILPPEPDIQVIKPDPIKALETLCNTGRVSHQLVNLATAKLNLTPVISQSPVDEGRRKRGELEDNVEVVCRLWQMKCLPWELLTTDAIALMVDANDQPSQGAVYSVLRRWADHNWAMVGRSPVRFVGFSDDAWQLGLTELRRRAKREADRRTKGFF